jgi:hypothetical protein
VRYNDYTSFNGEVEYMDHFVSHFSMSVHARTQACPRTHTTHTHSSLSLSFFLSLSLSHARSLPLSLALALALWQAAKWKYVDHFALSAVLLLVVVVIGIFARR